MLSRGLCGPLRAPPARPRGLATCEKIKPRRAARGPPEGHLEPFWSLDDIGIEIQIAMLTRGRVVHVLPAGMVDREWLLVTTARGYPLVHLVRHGQPVFACRLLHGESIPHDRRLSSEFSKRIFR